MQGAEGEDEKPVVVFTLTHTDLAAFDQRELAGEGLSSNFKPAGCSGTSTFYMDKKEKGEG